MKVREMNERAEALNENNGDLITRMMDVLEGRGYVDTDWRDECTFEEDVRPLFEVMIDNFIHNHFQDESQSSQDQEAKEKD